MWEISEPRWLNGLNVWFDGPVVVLRCRLSEPVAYIANHKPRLASEVRDAIGPLRFSGEPHPDLVRLAARVLRLQQQAGCRVQEGQIVSEAMPGVWTIALEIEERALAAEVVAWCRAAMPSPDDPDEAMQSRFHAMWEQARLETRTAELAVGRLRSVTNGPL